MNSYQPQLAVSTILNLDTSPASLPPKPELDKAPEVQPFQRVLKDQEQRRQAPDERRDPAADSSPAQSEPATREAAARADAELNHEMQADSENHSGEETQSDAAEVPQQAAENKETETDVAQVEEAILIEGQEAEGVSEIDVKTDAEPVELAAPAPAQDDTAESVVAAVAAIAEPERTPSGVKVSSESPLDPLKSYRVNVSGNPLELKEAKSGSAIEQFRLDKELGLAGKAEAAVSAVDAKPAAAKQLNNMMMQMVAAQPTRSAEQVMQDLAAKLDVKGRDSSLTPVTALTRPSVERPLNAPNAVVSPLQAQIKAAIGQPQWQAAISERVAFMASQNIKSAEIQLDPPELGPLQVRVTVTQDQASVAFASHHAQVREALDQTAFRLREMLQQEGMNQVDVDVSDQSEYQDRSQDSESSAASFARGGQESVEEEQSIQGIARVSTALVDHFV